jgi:ribonuclease HI
MPQKAIKGQAIADFLADHPIPESSKLYEDIPDEVAEACMIHASSGDQVWQLFFDGASRTGPRGNIVAGVGVVLVSPRNYVLPRAFSLTEPCTNNAAEYNALLIGMQLAEEIGVKRLEAYGDSKLIVNQVRGEYEVRHEDLIPYHEATVKLAERFENFYINHVPRRQNAHADALASLAASLALPAKAKEKVLVASRDLYCPKFSLEEVETIADAMENLEISTGPEPRDW